MLLSFSQIVWSSGFPINLTCSNAGGKRRYQATRGGAQ